jgi:hypothetical protein
MRPRVCVAIPVKNGTNYLDQAIESVLAQEGADIEVRVRDNLSDDESVALAQSYADRDPRVSVAVNEFDIGSWGSLNRILSETDAHYFVPFAHDDVMEPDNIARKVAALDAHDARMCLSSIRLIDGNGETIGLGGDHSTTPLVTDPPQFFEVITPINRVPGQSVVVATDALRAIGGFDNRGHFAADWLTWLRLSLRERVVTLRDPLIAYREHGTSGTTTVSATGIHGRDVPGVLAAAFRDDAMRPELLRHRPALMAHNLAHIGRMLHQSGLHRVADGWAGYMTIGRALAWRPEDPQLRSIYSNAVSESDLVPPRAPFDAVTSAPGTDDEAAALAGAVAELGPLLARLGIAVRPGDADDLMALLEPHFGQTALDVALIPAGGPSDLFQPGRLVLARWGSDLVSEAEAAHLPVYPYALPSLFAAPPDLSRWEAIDAEAVLAPSASDAGAVHTW